MSRRLAMFVVCVGLLGACSSSGSSRDDGSGTTPPDAAIATGVTDVGARTVAVSAGGGLTLETTSTRAALVSGGDVLLTVSGPAAGASVTVALDGDDVTAVFARDGDAWRGLVEGLGEGEHRVEATAGGETVALTVTNHPKNGPVFSGPHLEPWVCTTERHGLGPALDDDCDAPSRTTWSYRSTDGGLKPLDDPTERPADLATTDVGGEPVPFVVRAEQGVINRGVYWIWVLDPDPRPGDPWDATRWNERLVYRFGGGCGTQYSQGASLGVGPDLELLAEGYALATNTLDTFQTACNPTLSAEAALMTRERFVEQFGVPEHTIGDGGSGGAIQQLLIAHNYPGLLDAVSASVPYPDAVSIAGGVTDCGLLLHYYGTERGASLSEDQRTAINGHATTGTCASWASLFLSGVDPTVGCDGSLGDLVYHPETNPDGARCTLQDMNVNTLGRDPDTGFARRPLDNVGIQYGLQALERGVITVDEFLDLNEHIGGYDIDGNIVGERARMTDEAAARVYEVGAVIGEGPLLDVPIVLRNVYTDELGDIHTRYHAFSIRERLRVDGRDHPDLLLWTLPADAGDLVAGLTGAIADANEPIAILDEWLTTGERPAGAVQRCTLPDGGGEITGGWEVYDEPGPCTEAYPVFGDPRTVAGQPVRQEAVKCALVPVDASRHAVQFTAAQGARLAAMFPDGVCDWSEPGIGERPPTATWQDYGR